MSAMNNHYLNYYKKSKQSKHLSHIEIIHQTNILKEVNKFSDVKDLYPTPNLSCPDRAYTRNL